MNCKKSVLAGILIGIGGTVYLSCTSKELGAALFSLGLIAVVLLECNLYTGKVGYASKISDACTLAVMCLRNFAGAAIMGFAAQILLQNRDAAVNIVQKKLELGMGTAFVKAIMCGVMIYLAVELYKKTKQPWLIIPPIMIFILSGFEHCVADVFYFAAAGIFNLRAAAFIAVCVIGNAVGSIAVHLLQKYE